MAATPDCEIKTVEASIDDPAVARLVDEVNSLIKNINAETLRVTKEAEIEASIPSPHKDIPADAPAPTESLRGYRLTDSLNVELKHSGDVERAIESGVDVFVLKGGVKTKVDGLAGWSASKWQDYKAIRVGLMLAKSWKTMAKNITSTGGMVLGQQPLDEAMAIMFSKFEKDPSKRQAFREINEYYSGMWQGAKDSIHVVQQILKEAKTSGMITPEGIGKSLKKKGYDPSLAQRSSASIVSEMTEGRLLFTPDWKNAGSNPALLAQAGAQYLGNVAMQGSLGVLATSDIAFKMMAKRGKMRQVAFRDAWNSGARGSELDKAMSSRWDDLQKKIDNGEEISPSQTEWNQQGNVIANEGTFTEQAQTPFGAILSGQFETTNWFTKGLHEGMQVIAPFRSIFVNLNRQVFSRRLTPFIDRRTMSELKSSDAATRNLAKGRIAAGYTMATATASLVYGGYVKVWGQDEWNSQKRDLETQLTGKRGGHFQIGDGDEAVYVGIDFVPPGIAVTLAIMANAMEAHEDLNYKILKNPEMTGQEITMQVMGIMTQLATSDVWVREYMDFLGSTSRFVTNGDMKGLGGYLEKIAVGPVAVPDYIKGLYTPDSDLGANFTADGFIESLKVRNLGRTKDAGKQRNMWGRVILKPEYNGKGSDKPYYGAAKDIEAFLDEMNFVHYFPTNSSDKNLVGTAGRKGSGTMEGADTVPIPPKAREKFQYYAGQARMNGRNLEDSFREFMNSEGVLDPKTGKIQANMTEVVKATRGILANHRSFARFLITINPEFGLGEAQARKYYNAQVSSGVPEPQAQAEMQEKLKAMASAAIEFQDQL